MKRENLLVIFPDQYSNDMLGCYGNAICRTPNIDRLAERGVRFVNAYSNCPICIPARASLATGRYVHNARTWDNSFPYDGAIRSWHHRLRDCGIEATAIGKLHFRSNKDDNGFSEEINTMHMVSGAHSIIQCLRDETDTLNKRTEASKAGPGDTSYLRYDIANATRACEWIEQRRDQQDPWALLLGFVTPHPPMTAPPELFDYYWNQDLPLPPQWAPEEWPQHPAMAVLRRFFQFHEPLDRDSVRRFIAAYYALCEFVDQQVGRVLETLEHTGLIESTRILFLSDHGECRGARGVFGKFNMYDEASAVPCIMCGPDVPAGRVVSTPVSLVDCYPTVLESFDIAPDAEEENLPGKSLFSFLNDAHADRTIFAEYHAIGSREAIYMLRNRKYKYIYHVRQSPQLFDMEADPQEVHDLAQNAEYGDLLRSFERQLRAIVDPEAVDAEAKKDQMDQVAAAGGADRIKQAGTFENTPVPGEEPVVYKGASESR